MFLCQENFLFSRLPAGHKVEYIYLYFKNGPNPTEPIPQNHSYKITYAEWS